MSSKRRYAKLLRLAEDQRGTPEGDLAEKLSKTMLAADPSLATDNAELRDPVERSFRWKTEHDQLLLAQCFRYFDVEDVYTYKKKRAKLLYATDDPIVLVAVEEAYASLRKPLHDFVKYSVLGFLHGSLPTSHRDDGDDDSPPLSDEELEALRNGFSQGTGHSVMKAIEDGEPS